MTPRQAEGSRTNSKNPTHQAALPAHKNKPLVCVRKFALSVRQRSEGKYG